LWKKNDLKNNKTVQYSEPYATATNQIIQQKPKAKVTGNLYFRSVQTFTERKRAKMIGNGLL